MTKYEELLSKLKQQNSLDAERVEEEMDIIVHKLKFLAAENFPKVIVLNQYSGFQPSYSDILSEKIKIAGGKLMRSFIDSNPDIIIVIEQNHTLYSTLPTLLDQPEIRLSKAYEANAVYVVYNTMFEDYDEHYLMDIEILAEILQPKYFFFGREGQDWVKFSID